MARSEGGLCGFPIYRQTTTAPKTSECSSIVSMQYVWKIDVVSIFSNTNTFKNTIHAIHQTLLPEYTIPSTPAVWNLRFRSSGKLARFYSSLTHHWMLFFFSAQVASGLQGHTTTWWSWEQNFQVDFLLNVCKSHHISSSTTMLIHIKIKMISRINQILGGCP